VVRGVGEHLTAADEHHELGLRERGQVGIHDLLLRGGRGHLRVRRPAHVPLAVHKAAPQKASPLKPRCIAYVNQMRAQARQQSQSTEAQYVSGGKPSIAEHDVRLASGGSSEYMSVSDPEFKQHKDNLEAIVQRQFGGQAVVDIDDVSGETRIIPTQVHNKFQPTSQQLGVDVPQGTDINQGIEKVRQLLKRVQKPTARFRAGSPMGIDLIGGPMTDIMPPSQEGYGPGGIIRTIPTAQERL